MHILGQTSYLEIVVINGISGWHSFKSYVGNITGIKAEYSSSLCSGQFSHTSLLNSLTSLKINAPQGIRIINGTVQIYTY